jgi:hypothetical protein
MGNSDTNNQTHQELIPLVGVDDGLYYSSDRVASRTDFRTFYVSLGCMKTILWTVLGRMKMVK